VKNSKLGETEATAEFEKFESRDEDNEPLPPPRSPTRRIKKRMAKPTISGSPIRKKSTVTSRIKKKKGSARVQKERAAAEIKEIMETQHGDSITTAIGAIVRAFIDEGSSIYIKRNENNFFVEHNNGLIEFQIVNGKPEFTRTLRTSKESIRIKELEKRINDIL
ncbi:MAG: hypothetical protein ACTSRU_10930, partial [Candidatus Hodarchaeales archaeon]